MSQDFNDPSIKDPKPTSPIVPVRLGLDDSIQFRCRKGIACFNKCCENIDIMLTPYDILQLKNRLNLSSAEFIAKHTRQFEMDAHGMPGLKMKTKEDSQACQFLTPEGCGVYEDRPAACRYYALGMTSMRAKDSPTDEDFYFVVKEQHCLGHFEPRTLSVREYRREQGIEEYDDHNREWRQVVLKKRSSGPTVGRPSDKSMELFYLASYDLDNFRIFISSPFFHEVYDIPGDQFQRLVFDEVELLKFAARYLKQVLYGENTIPEKPDAVEKRTKRRQEIIEKQRAQMCKDMESEIDSPSD